MYKNLTFAVGLFEEGSMTPSLLSVFGLVGSLISLGLLAGFKGVPFYRILGICDEQSNRISKARASNLNTAGKSAGFSVWKLTWSLELLRLEDDDFACGPITGDMLGSFGPITGDLLGSWGPITGDLDFICGLLTGGACFFADPVPPRNGKRYFIKLLLSIGIESEEKKITKEISYTFETNFSS